MKKGKSENFSGFFAKIDLDEIQALLLSSTLIREKCELILEEFRLSDFLEESFFIMTGFLRSRIDFLKALDTMLIGEQTNKELECAIM